MSTTPVARSAVVLIQRRQAIALCTWSGRKAVPGRPEAFDATDLRDHLPSHRFDVSCRDAYSEILTGVPTASPNGAQAPV